MITQTEVERARLLPNFSPVIMRHAQLPGTALTLSSSGSRTMPGFHGTILGLLSHPSILTLGDQYLLPGSCCPASTAVCCPPGESPSPLAQRQMGEGPALWLESQAGPSHRGETEYLVDALYLGWRVEIPVSLLVASTSGRITTGLSQQQGVLRMP